MLKNAAGWIDLCQSANHFFSAFLLRLQMKAAVSQYLEALISFEVVAQFGPPAGICTSEDLLGRNPIWLPMLLANDERPQAT